MRKLLVNALSVTNPSGRHVLAGHLKQVAEALAGRLRLAVLCRADMAELQRGLGDRVDWVWAPPVTRGWFCRAAWERTHLRHLARRLGATAYFTPSGIAAPELELPQIVFCQNPWALVPAARRRRDAVKAWLQRRAYRRAMRTATVMVFNSRYMQDAYRRNAGFSEKRGLVVYQAAEETADPPGPDVPDIPRRPGQILCVSVMGPHKNVETLVRALAVVRMARPEVRLVLAGSWPDAAYARWIRALVAQLSLSAAVDFTGFIPRARLEQLYAESQVFCLMSRCESFGLPAIDAQRRGVPVISSNVCAIPEVCGAGGRYVDPDDVSGVAAALQDLLSDRAEWQRLSSLARRNAARFTWPQVSRPLVDLLAELAAP